MSKFSYFRIAGEQLDLVWLEKMFGKYDVHICKKGEEYYNKYTKEATIFKEDIFRFDIENKDNAAENELISHIINIVMPYKKQIKAFPKVSSTLIGLSLYPDGYHYCVSYHPKA